MQYSKLKSASQGRGALQVYSVAAAHERAIGSCDTLYMRMYLCGGLGDAEEKQVCLSMFRCPDVSLPACHECPGCGRQRALKEREKEGADTSTQQRRELRVSVVCMTSQPRGVVYAQPRRTYVHTFRCTQTPATWWLVYS